MTVHQLPSEALVERDSDRGIVDDVEHRTQTLHEGMVGGRDEQGAAQSGPPSVRLDEQSGHAYQSLERTASGSGQDRIHDVRVQGDMPFNAVVAGRYPGCDLGGCIQPGPRTDGPPIRVAIRGVDSGERLHARWKISSETSSDHHASNLRRP